MADRDTYILPQYFQNLTVELDNIDETPETTCIVDMHIDMIYYIPHIVEGMGITAWLGNANPGESKQIRFLDHAYRILTAYLEGACIAKLLDNLHVCLRDYSELLFATNGSMLPITMFLIDIGLRLPNIFDDALRSIISNIPDNGTMMSDCVRELAEPFKQEDYGKHIWYRLWGDRNDPPAILGLYVKRPMSFNSLAQSNKLHTDVIELLNQAKTMGSINKPARP